MRTIDIHTADGILLRAHGVGVIDCYATPETSVPEDGVQGYAPGCICRDTVNGILYINEGTFESCDFNAVQMA